MRELEDARRSLSTYLSKEFTEYDHYLHREDGAFERPAVVVKKVGDLLSPDTGGWAMIDLTQPFAVYVYPLPAADVEQAETNKVQVEQRLWSVFKRGIRLEASGERLGAWNRVPLWDFADLTLNQALPMDREVDGYMRATSVTISSSQEEQDNRLWTIVLNVRLSWRQTGPERDPGPLISEPIRWDRQVS